MDPSIDPTQPLTDAKSPTVPASRWIPPTPADLSGRIPGLAIESLIGQGGMAAVYRARHLSLGRQVALKLLSPHVAADPGITERFVREARAMAAMDHPGIVAVYDHGKVDDLLWMTMELADGANLRQVLRTGSLSPETALRLVPRLCEAVQYAHEHGVVHRDLKPENILIDAEGLPHIVDFGLAKTQDSQNDDLTQSGQILGTYRYMAPEQLAGSTTVDHRADIFALGVVFYELLTGALPQGRFEPPSRRVAVDVRLDEVVLRALERDPQQRYQRAADLGTAVTAINAGPSGRATDSARSSTTATPTPSTGWQNFKHCRRSRSDWILGGVCSGLGQSTPLPTWFYRVIFLVLTVVWSSTWGAGFAIYLILWATMPAGNDTPRRFAPLRWIVAMLLVLVALAFVIPGLMKPTTTHAQAMSEPLIEPSTR